MNRIIKIFILFVLFTSGLISQEIQTDESSEKEVYSSAFSKAFKDGKISREERALLRSLQESLNLSQEEIDQIEQEIRATAVLKFGKKLDTSGRWIVFTQNIIYASTFYGWGIPYVLDAEDIKWYVGCEMISIPTGFALTYYSTSGKEYPYSRAFFHLYGSLLSANAMDAFYSNTSHKSLKKRMVFNMVFTPLGINVADRMYRTFKPSMGQTLTIMMFGAFGSSGFYDIYRYVERPPETDEYLFEEDSTNEKYKRWEARAAIFRLLGHPFGIWLERKYFGSRSYSTGDAVLLFVGNRTGFYYTTLLDLLVNGEVNLFRINMIPAQIAGMCLGTFFTDRFLEGKDYSFGQSVIFTLGGIAGDFFMMGVDVILEVKNVRIFAASQLIGSAAGFYFINKLINPSSDSALESRKSDITVVPSFVYGKRGINPSISINWTF